MCKFYNVNLTWRCPQCSCACPDRLHSSRGRPGRRQQLQQQRLCPSNRLKKKDSVGGNGLCNVDLPLALGGAISLSLRVGPVRTCSTGARALRTGWRAYWRRLLKLGFDCCRKAWEDLPTRRELALGRAAVDNASRSNILLLWWNSLWSQWNYSLQPNVCVYQMWLYWIFVNCLADI